MIIIYQLQVHVNKHRVQDLGKFTLHKQKDEINTQSNIIREQQTDVFQEHCFILYSSKNQELY